MKNLITLNKGQLAPVSRTYPDLEVVAAVFEPFSDSLTVALGADEAEAIEVQQFTKTGETILLASIPTQPGDKVLSFNQFADSAQLVFVFKGGDIVCATYDVASPSPDTTVVEIMGSIDCGLECAEWSTDSDTLAIITREFNVVLLSRLFEPTAERFIDPKDISQSSHVSVGWGKKETQFQGKGAKALERQKEALKHAGLDVENETQLRDPTLGKKEDGQLSSLEDFSCKISWRGDSQFFSISCVEQGSELQRRVVRVYSRDGELESCSEPVDELGAQLSWKPQGALIASTQRTAEDLNVVFLEKNGLRHGEFNVRTNDELIGLDWSCNSEMLAMQFPHSVQIWTVKNYHWYLKQEIFTKESQDTKFMQFHPEKPFRLMVGTASRVEIIDMAYCVTSGPSVSPMDVGMCAVIDGTTIGMTALGIANVPPPMFYRECELEENVLCVSVNESNNKFGAVSHNRVSFVAWDICDRKSSPSTVSTLTKDLFSESHDQLRQIVVWQNMSAVLFDSGNNSKIAIFDTTEFESPILKNVLSPPMKVVLMKQTADWQHATFETMNGSVFKINPDGTEFELICRLPQLCCDYETGFPSDSRTHVVFGVTSNGKLFSNDKQLASAVTSLKLTDAHLLYTTAQHQLKFMHLVEPFQVPEAAGEVSDERIRMIERGSLLVSVMPSKASVVLQAPRGNLETIFPRIMVLSGVRRDIKAKQYKSAFLTCRTHRIDLDILHDYDPELFFEDIELFVNQIDSVAHMDLFVSCLHDEDVARTKYGETLRLSGEEQKPEVKVENKINKICEGVLSILKLPKYRKRYMQTIITAYACEKPANLESALVTIASLPEVELEKYVIHLCFLQDVNKLCDVSLGTYNVPLTLMIAQQSQKDPKEYLPFLQNLHIQPLLRKQFMIDSHLKKYTKALDSLTSITDDPQIEQEIEKFIVDKNLYQYALGLFKYDPSRTARVLRSYAEHLFDTQQFAESGLCYESLKEYEMAMKAYTSGKKWREAISLAHLPELKESLKTCCLDLVSSLTEDHKYAEAAEIEFYQLNNLERSMELFGKDFYYDRAILLAMSENRQELVESIVDPSLGEGFGAIAELIADCTNQVSSQMKRLRELRAKKEEDPYAFYGDGVENIETPDNVSIAASETSTKESFFTRYTGKTGGTARTGASRKTAKNKRREERKRARGKKGTIYEEEYLVKSTGRLIERLAKSEPEAVRLIEGLLRRNKREQAYQVQKNFVSLVGFLKENVVEIYSISERDRERVDDNGMVYLIPEIPIPTIQDFPKKSNLDY